jgi:hypothetical protein
MDIDALGEVFKLQTHLTERFFEQLEAIQKLDPADVARARRKQDAEMAAVLKARLKVATAERSRVAARYDDEIRSYEAAIAELSGAAPAKKAKGKATTRTKRGPATTE